MKIGKSESTGRYYDMDTGQEVSGAAAETGPWESALIGAGRTVHNLGENLGIFKNDPNADQAMADLRSVNPKSTFAGEAGASMIPMMKAGKLLTLGQAAGASYLTGDPESSAAGRALMGAGGQYAGDMLGRVLSRAGKLVTESAPPLEGSNKMAKQFKDSGGRLTPAQATGDANLQALEANLRSQPGSAGLLQKHNEMNQANTNKLAMKAIGVKPTGRNQLTDDVLQEAEENIQRRFSDVAEGIPTIHLSEEMSDQVRDIVGTSRQAQRVWKKQTGKTLPLEGTITANGKALMRMRNYANKRTTSSNQNQVSDSIDLIEQIDNLVEEASDRAPQYREARAQWRALKSIDRPGSMTSAGDVNPTSSYGKLRNWRNAPGEQGLLRDNVQAASALQLPFGNSGTAQRSGDIAGKGLRAGPAWLAGKAYLNAPARLAEVGAGPASNLGIGTTARGLLSPGGQLEDYEKLK